MRVFSALIFGPMEHGERRTPNCVEAIFRSMYLETSGWYMGSRDTYAQPEELKEESTLCDASLIC